MIRADSLSPFQWSVAQPFLSCDWGTSSLRLRLADPVTMEIVAEERSGKGIRDTFLRWQETGSADPAKRISFYLAVIRELINNMERKMAVKLPGVPVILSGMASSSIGLLELPYQILPFHAGKDKPINSMLLSTEAFPHPVLLISGLKKKDDVMRGEETQLTGCLYDVISARQDEKKKRLVNGEEIVAMEEGNKLYLFPGTHSKHILVKEDTIIDFTTYMTGEFFQLLSEKSLLSGSVEKEEEPDLKSAGNLAAFQQGVRDAAADANLLHSAFRVRTQELFQQVSKKQSFYYLSGLLIGTELTALLNRDRAPGNGLKPVEDSTRFFLCCGEGLRDYYEKALEAIALCKRVHIFPADWVDNAVVRGQFLILKQCIR